MSFKSIPLVVSLQLLIIAANGQKVSLSVKSAKVETVFGSIRNQTNYIINYNSRLVRRTNPVSINVKNADVDYVLDLCCKDQIITYTIKGNVITIKKRPRIINERPEQRDTVLGKVQAKEETERNSKWLKEMTVTAYGKNSNRLITGSIGKVSAGDIEKQSTGNLLSAVTGIPGILFNQSSGLPGAAISMQIRGQSSIGIVPGYLPASSILFIVDGVPFASRNNSMQVSAASTALGGAGSSPFAAINPDDIESIEVLKDADATAIYGSRGADGVVLITTRQGRGGKGLFTANIYSAINVAATIPDMLNSRQFYQMRHEALLNDNLNPTPGNSPDLLLFDSTRDTNFESMLLSETAKTVNAHISFSGGDSNTQYLMSAGHRYETTVFPGNVGNNRTSLHLHLAHNSANHRFFFQVSTLFAIDKNRTISTDLTSALILPPNYPDLYDSLNNLVWQQKGFAIQNPRAYLLQPYISKTNNFISNFQFGYRFFNLFTAKASFGYNRLRFEESSKIPGRSLNPFVIPDPTGSLFLGYNTYNSWIIEPQIEYSNKIAGGNLTCLVGGGFEQVINRRNSVSATGFTNDEELININAAAKVLHTEDLSIYRYTGMFGRLSYNWQNRYIVNFTGRRDGSSRFGPKKRFGNFGSIGSAWIFTNESFLKDKIPFINFGKLRCSYGITGNDQIGDYKYLDRWLPTTMAYQGNTGIVPTQIADSSYSWELTQKLEGALELGFWNNRICLIVDYFHNRTGNQLIAQVLPSATGFTSIPAKNSKAIVQNTGFEITLKSNNICKKSISWLNEFTVTFPRNILFSFPGLAGSNYANIFMEKRSLTWNIGYDHIGVDPATGVFQYVDQDGDGKLSYPNDYIEIGNLDPKFYGWFKSSLAIKNWAFDVAIEFKKQMGYSNLFHVYNIGLPGTPMLNQPDIVLDRWQRPGDNARFQRFTTISNSEAGKASTNLLQSSGRFGDASYISIRNVSLSFNFPAKWVNKFHLNKACLYLRGRNVLTLTDSNVFGQQTFSPYALSPMRTFSVGLQCSF